MRLTGFIIVWPRLFRLPYLKGMAALAILPIIFLQNNAYRYNQKLLNHERIHFAQTLELFILPFYVWYLYEYFKLRFKGNSHQEAYRQNRFEKEAYANEHDMNYLKKRPFLNFLQY
ncbi:MAG: hypothetical protein EAZ57_07405 [Cytophagales bacterium]|nr:MAG: hypothetical protein EAZ67_08490 [Cytophagales bacterium]TAF60364.1 MAG: hypothetical protein EAZ57_07405 [Cytophagales bacterium]